MLLSVADLCRKHRIEVTGVLHLGAHLGEECSEYLNMTTGPIVWVEGQISQATQMRRTAYPREFVYSSWIGCPDKYDKPFATVYEASNSQSTSLKRPLKHLEYYPDIWFSPSQGACEVTPLDDFWNKLPPSTARDLNLLAMDIQGGEGDAVLTGKQTLENMQAVYMEVNTELLYEDIVLLADMDVLMRDRGFLRVDTMMTPASWGDAFYIRVRV